MRDGLLFEVSNDVVLSINEKKSGDNSVVLGLGRSRSLACVRRVTPTSVTGNGVERFLPNGDIYLGSLSGKVPHGFGKYLWTDGCMHEGEWRRGKASGKGRFSWSTGATYEGEFKSGRMEGFGTFIGIYGDTYRGSWSEDRKHGFGRKRYANGDFYEGSWKRNFQDGKGRYVWSNGNEYVGEWKNGVISGRGVLIWVNGNRYDGKWENGVPKGKGVFTWLDGSCHVGIWNDGPFSGDDFTAAPAGRKRSSVDSSKICVWDSEGDAGDITCDIIDNVERSKCYRRNSCCFSGEVKKPGKTISKGHKNYDLMINLQLGIRHSVGRYSSIVRELKASDFDPKEKFWTKFPSVEFRWKDYCPIVFRHLRELFEVDPDDYMQAICGNDALRELSSPGKSGSFFYLTQDDRFMIKTVKKSEVKVLIRMLSSYYQHISKYKNSLVTKFFGVHCVKPIGGQKTRFIVMDNLFCSEYRIHRRFDLKGSSHGRTTDKLVGEIDETSTLKDLDLNFVFRLQGNRFQELMKQIDRDCKFLEAERIMDYSLLVGLHFRDVNTRDIILSSPIPFHLGKKDSYQNEKFMSECHFLEANIHETDTVFAGRNLMIRFGASMPARAERVVRRSDFDQFTPSRFDHLTPSHSGEIYEVVLYFGIIDILQDYDITKKLEHAYKSLQADPTSISAVDPKLYSKRFRDFIGQIFVEER